MSDFSDWAENEVCRILAGGAPAFPDDFDVALCSAAADDAFVDVAGLPRVSAPRDLQTWSGTQGAGSVTPSTGTSRAISNNVAFDFGEAGEDATANAIGIYSGDNPLAYILLNTPMAINTGDEVQIEAGEIVLTISSVGGLTHYAANKLLDLIFRGQAFVFPATYQVALFTGVPTLAGGGTEVSGGGYTRASLSAWTAPAGGVMTNADTVQFSAPQGAWGTVRAGGLVHDGSLIFTAELADAKTISAGAGAPKFPAGAISLSVQ